MKTLTILILLISLPLQNIGQIWWEKAQQFSIPDSLSDKVLRINYFEISELYNTQKQVDKANLLLVKRFEQYYPFKYEIVDRLEKDKDSVTYVYFQYNPIIFKQSPDQGAYKFNKYYFFDPVTKKKYPAIDLLDRHTKLKRLKSILKKIQENSSEF